MIQQGVGEFIHICIELAVRPGAVSMRIHHGFLVRQPAHDTKETLDICKVTLEYLPEHILLFRSSVIHQFINGDIQCFCNLQCIRNCWIRAASAVFLYHVIGNPRAVR